MKAKRQTIRKAEGDFKEADDTEAEGDFKEADDTK